MCYGSCLHCTPEPVAGTIPKGLMTAVKVVYWQGRGSFSLLDELFQSDVDNILFCFS